MEPDRPGSNQEKAPDNSNQQQAPDGGSQEQTSSTPTSPSPAVTRPQRPAAPLRIATGDLLLVEPDPPASSSQRQAPSTPLSAISPFSRTPTFSGWWGSSPGGRAGGAGPHHLEVLPEDDSGSSSSAPRSKPGRPSASSTPSTAQGSSPVTFQKSRWRHVDSSEIGRMEPPTPRTPWSPWSPRLPAHSPGANSEMGPRRESMWAAPRRRASEAVLNAIHTIDPLHTHDNPLGLQINEIARVSSVDYSGWTSFNARRYSEAGPPPSAGGFIASLRKQSIVRQGMSEKEDDYSIQRLAKHDDIELMSRWKRWAYRLSAPFAILTITIYFVYFVLRILFTRSAERQAHKVYWMAWAFIVIEIIVLIPMLLHRLWGLHAIGMRRRPKLRIIGENVPSVDVIITCCGEDDDLVLDTAKAACNIDYPRSRFRVIICDDGNSSGLREKTERTALEQFDNLYYRSRPKYPGVPHHFKAGNLNYALEETQNLPLGAANFFAALDADMIPEKDWLRALIPHMIQDPKCCMACPPQLFYNVPKDDPLCQSLDLFVHVSEPMKDSLGVAWCTGSGYVMRRQALESIGRFPTGSLAEDVCTSSMLLGTGWNTAFVHEPLQFGTVPDSLTSHLKQRTRWTIGTVQTSLKLRFCLWGPLVTRMTFFQRLCGFVYTISSLLTVVLVLSMFTSPVVLISGGNLVPFSNYRQLRWLIRAWFASHIINRGNEFVTYLPSGYLTGQREARAVMWMAIFQSISIIRTFVLPSWLGGKVAVFTSSGSQKAELDERDPERRAPLWRRLKVTIWDCQCYLHLLYIAFVIVAVVLGTYWNFQRYSSRKDLLVAILTHAGWPPILWLTCILSCWTPIMYAIFPPNCPQREDLLERDPKTGVAYPKASSKTTQIGWGTWAHEVQYSLLSVYTLVIFILSFGLK